MNHAVTRRGLLLGGAAAALSKTLVARSASGGDPDVIVIGGGFAGVTAARECARRGYSVVLLEASNRIGGRTFTSMVDGEVIELGGYMVGWMQPYVWSEIARYGLRLVPKPALDAQEILLQRASGQVERYAAQEIGPRLDQTMRDYLSRSREILPYPFSAPVGDLERWNQLSGADVLRDAHVDDRMHDFLTAMFSTQAGGSLDSVGWLEFVRWFALSGHDTWAMNENTLRFTIEGGIARLAQAMLQESKADVRLGAPVQAVRADAGGVLVTLQIGTQLRARAAVVAVPLNVLQTIDFQPALSPAKAEAARIGHLGRGMKVDIHIEGALPHNTMAFSAYGQPLNFLMTEAVGSNRSVLTSYIANPDVIDTNDWDAVQTALRKLLPEARVTACYSYPWHLDPYFRGSWCMFRPGGFGARLEALQASHGRIVFANADWATGWRSFIDGAVERGLVAGHAIESLLS